MTGANPPDPRLDVIERQTAVLMRNFELLHRRTRIHDRLDRAQYLLLRTLADGGPMAITALAATLGLDPSTAGRQVAALTAAGLVERGADPADRRRSVLTPSAAGLREMWTVREQRVASHAELLGDFSPEELGTLGALLDRYNRAVAARYLIPTATATATDGKGDGKGDGDNDRGHGSDGDGDRRGGPSPGVTVRRRPAVTTGRRPRHG